METVNIAPKGNAAEIEEAAAEVERTHLAVADAAGWWVDAGCPRIGDGDDEREGEDAAAELRDAVRAWRKAGERLVVAMRGGK
jgi:hypothetical protein